MYLNPKHINEISPSKQKGASTKFMKNSSVRAVLQTCSPKPSMSPQGLQSADAHQYFHCSSKGFSLLEALVALVVFAMGMIGIGHMLLLTHKSNASNHLRQQAIQAAYNITDRIRANRNAAINGSYNVSNLVTSGAPTLPSTPSTNCGTTACSSTQLATYDTWYWLTTTLPQLPNGCGAITTATSGSNTVITVTVQWNDSPTQQFLGATSANSQQFSIQTQL